MPQDETENCLPVVIAGFAYDRSDIVDPIRECLKLSETIAHTAERLKVEDPESDRADLYLLAMLTLLRDTFAGTLKEMQNYLFLSSDLSPDESIEKATRFMEMLSEFNIGISEAVENVNLK